MGNKVSFKVFFLSDKYTYKEKSGAWQYFIQCKIEKQKNNGIHAVLQFKEQKLINGPLLQVLAQF